MGRLRRVGRVRRVGVVTAGAGLLVVTSTFVLGVAPPTSNAARRNVVSRVRTKKAVVGASSTLPPTTLTPTTLAPATPAPTTTIAGIPPAKIVAFEATTGKIRLALEPPTRADLAASLTVDAIGFEEGTRTLVFPVGVTDQTVSASLNPDTQYTFRVRWKAPDSTFGLEDTRSVAPFFPQPKYRGPVPVAGQGWSVIFTSDFTPTRRNPCAPIDVFYDTTNQQLDLTSTVQSAVAQASAASGVPMRLVGAGKVRPTTPRVLIIDWVAGQTDWLGVTRQGNEKDARGVFWRTTLSISLAASRGVAQGRWETVILHEIGHVLGLQHSHDPASLMFSPLESKGSWPWVTTVFTEGDRSGLYAVNAGASGGCSPTISPGDLWNGQQGP